MDDITTLLKERQSRWESPKLDLAQAQLSLRAPIICSALKQKGWRFLADINAFECAGIRIFVSHGNPQVQRRLNLEKPYSQFIVKSVNMPAEVIQDDASQSIDATLLAIQLAVDHVRAASA